MTDDTALSQQVVEDQCINTSDLSVSSDAVSVNLNACAVMYGSNGKFGSLGSIPTSLINPDYNVMPSTDIKLDELRHLSESQQSECSSDYSDFSDVISQTITLEEGFRPRQLPAYGVNICPPTGPKDDPPVCIHQGVPKNKVVSATSCREGYWQLVRPPEYLLPHGELYGRSL